MALVPEPFAALRALELLFVREGAVVVRVAKETDKENKLKTLKSCQTR